MTVREKSRRPTVLTNPDYLRDLQALPARKLMAKWGLGRSAVYNHQKMTSKEIGQRLAEAEVCASSKK